jgi:hypothetical protein
MDHVSKWLMCEGIARLNDSLKFAARPQIVLTDSWRDELHDERPKEFQHTFHIELPRRYAQTPE